ncbi:MAG: hypothetical protein EOO04_14770 [Chitinophagaceae bacterium]|nr:MAG: hypothetical protein EOO04_14770 [Chitinophagaceae bacterium]
MKQFAAIIILLSVVFDLKATTITAQVNNAKWSLASSWNPNRTPANGDTIVIPAGLNIKVDGNENLSNVVVVVRGTLTFTNGKLRLDALSKVIVYFGGTITGGGNNDQISIDGVFKYRGTDPDVLGYAVADTSTGSGFGVFSILPFSFVSFTALSTATGVQLNWSYNYSPETRSFTIQRSVDGRNWNSISEVFAKNNGSELQHYQTLISASDFDIVYYRVVQKDNNGKLLYSEVKAVAGKTSEGSIAAEDADIKAYVNGGAVLVRMAGKTTGSVTVRLLNTNGQIIRQQQFDQPDYQVSMPVMKSVQGIHIVQVIQSNKKVNSIRLMF